MNEISIGRSSLTERTTMSDSPSELLLNNQSTKSRLGDVFEAPSDPARGIPSLLITGSGFAPTDRNEAAKPWRAAQNLMRSRVIFRDLTRNRRQQSNRTKGDMTASCFTLTLLFVATLVAAYTDRPAFWLLMGPVPLATGFAMIAFLQPKLGRRGR
jgi:hypothetical protein